MEDKTFVFHSEWLESIKGLDLELQDKIIADIARYGCREGTKYDDIAQITSYVNLLKTRIDNSVNTYERNKMTKEEQRLSVDQRIYMLAHQGLTAQEVAEAVGKSVSTVNHSNGWRKRKDVEYTPLS